MKNNCICFIMGILCAFSAYSQHDDVKRLMQQYHYREAAQQLQNESETPENLRLKAECFEKLYRYQDAIAMYEKLVQTHPSDINIVIALAEVSAQAGNADVNLMYYLGRSLVDTYDKKRGIRILQRGINKINEQQAMLYDFDTSIGYGHLRLQQYAKSIEAFKKAYARKKTNTSILYNIAFAYDALKNYDAAIDYYEQFLKTTSDNYVSNKQEYEDTANISSRKEMCRIVKKRIEELKKELFFKGKK